MSHANTRYHANLSDAAKRARADYAKEWRKKNPDKQKAINDRYWEKKAQAKDKGTQQPGPAEQGAE